MCSKNNPIFYLVYCRVPRQAIPTGGRRQSLQCCMYFRTEQGRRILLCKADSPDNGWEILSSHSNLQFLCSFPIFYCASFPPFVYHPVKCFLFFILAWRHIYTAECLQVVENSTEPMGQQPSGFISQTPCCRVTRSGPGHSAGQHGCRHTCMCIRFWFTDLSCVLLRVVNNHHSLRFPPHSGISSALKEPWRLFWNFYCIKGLVRQQSHFIWNNNRKPTWSAARRDQTTP